MKNQLIIILFIAAAFVSQAQETKPTKEETFNFLNENFFKKEITHIDWVDEYGSKKDRYWNLIRYQNIVIDGCLIRGVNTTTYNISVNYGKPIQNDKKETYIIIDFSKVERIESKSTRRDEGGDYLYSFLFYIQEKEGEINVVELPFISSKVPLEVVLKDYKIYQAFNHLRKLCGAPEPIKFD